MTHQKRRRQLLALAAVGLIGLMAQRGDESSTAPAAHVDRAPLTPIAPRVDHSEPARVQVGQAARSVTGRPVYADDQLLVALAEGESLGELAAAHGAAVLREVGRSGFGAVALPEGASLADFGRALRADARVQGVAPQGLTYGAGKGGGGKGGKDKPSDPPPVDTAPPEDTAPPVDTGSPWDTGGEPLSMEALQWHFAATDASYGTLGGGYATVAVLDTGVAYEDYTDTDGTVYVQAPSLSSLWILSPWDFVNDDAHPNDDHQHGTHITSTIASYGDVSGVAAAVPIIPIKVLDANNRGTELDLVEGIYWAVDSGATIVNMSLTFGEGYQPSAALAAALDYAVAHDVIMVAAAGNDGLSEVGYPAASPAVLAVGASCLAPDGGLALADYSNAGAGVELIAPGGCVDADNNDDGYPDGILAETIALNDPEQIGYWFYAGSSQATAIATGALVRVLSSYIDPGEARFALQDGAMPAGADAVERGYGAGWLDIGESESISNLFAESDYAATRFHVALMPYLSDGRDGTVSPGVRLTVLDQTLEPAADVRVLGRFQGATSASFSCTLSASSDGTCTVTGTPADSADGAAPLAWQISVDAVIVDNLIYRGEGLLFASDTLDALVGAVGADPSLAEALLAIHWPAEDDPALGALAESYAVVNSGTGITTSPFGVVFTPPLLDGHTVEEVSVDGSGITTSPFSLRLVTFDGSGITTSPFSRQLLAFNGTGITTSPFSARSLLTPDEAGDCPSCTFDGDPILLGSGSLATPAGVDVSGTSLQTLMDAGGWVTSDGYQGANVLLGSGAVEVPAEAVGSGVGAGASPM